MTITIEELRLAQNQDVVDIISTLRSVEINAIDICNRSCSFCPRSSDAYVNKTEQISLATIQKIANDLNDINYTGRVSFAGFGEPSLFKNLTASIKIIKDTVKSIKWIEIITNADYITADKISEWSAAGCSNILVSMYDVDRSDEILNLKGENPILINFRNYVNGFNHVNRKNILTSSESLNISRPCLIPFYKMFIDVDGDVLLCSHDWTRNSKMGNVKTETIKNIWLGNAINMYRSELAVGNRKNCSPCQFCNVDGLLAGQESFNFLENYDRSSIQ